MGRLLKTLEGCCLGDLLLKDERLWSLDDENGFFVKSMYNAMDQRTSLSFPSLFIWNKDVPSKISFFMWTLSWDRAPTLDNLIHRGFVSPNRCSMCGVDGVFGTPIHSLFCGFIVMVLYDSPL